MLPSASHTLHLPSENATGNSVTFSLTSSEITTFKKYKGFGLQATATGSKAQYSVCSGTMKVKITYKE